MLSGQLYCADDPELKAMSRRRAEIIAKFNNEADLDIEAKEKLLFSLFAHVGEGSFINWPFRCDYGTNISLGDHFYANYDCIFLDVNKITIGNNVFLAPRVCIYTAGHPIDKNIRNLQLEYGYPVEIGDDVWIGGNVVINPGVKIGSNVVIGAGSVVTHDIPSDVVAAGVPCRVIRKITSEDRLYWEEKRSIYEMSKTK